MTQSTTPQGSNTQPGLSLSGTPQVFQPKMVGIWRLTQRLHQGQWCDVYASQPADALGSPRCDYAVKIARKSMQEDPEALRQLRAEAAAAAAARHPHLVTVLDGHLEASRPYLVMPRIEGETLAAMVSREAQPLPIVLWWVRQTAEALQALHSAGWTHGDLKPENILVDRRGHLTLMDLGLAMPVGAPLGKQFRGTIDNAAPEVAAGEAKTASSAADVYSLGMMLDKLTRTNGTMSDAVYRIVSQAMAASVRQRPSAEAIAAQLLRLEIETLHLHIRPPADESGKRAA